MSENSSNPPLDNQNDKQNDTPIDWEARAGEYLAGWKRSQADFANAQKDTERRTAEWMRMANAELLRQLIPVYESVCAAAGHDPELEPLRKQFEEVLRNVGFVRMDVIGKPFDPLYHEAVGRRADEGAETNTILEEISTGYLLHDRVLKPAKVVVAS